MTIIIILNSIPKLFCEERLVKATWHSFLRYKDSYIIEFIIKKQEDIFTPNPQIKSK